MVLLPALLQEDLVSHPVGVPDASGFMLTFGYKRYF